MRCSESETAGERVRGPRGAGRMGGQRLPLRRSQHSRCKSCCCISALAARTPSEQCNLPSTVGRRDGRQRPLNRSPGASVRNHCAPQGNTALHWEVRTSDSRRQVAMVAARRRVARRLRASHLLHCSRECIARCRSDDSEPQRRARLSSAATCHGRLNRDTCHRVLTVMIPARDLQ
jgi:hypothetical protein